MLKTAKLFIHDTRKNVRTYNEEDLIMENTDIFIKEDCENKLKKEGGMRYIRRKERKRKGEGDHLFLTGGISGWPSLCWWNTKCIFF